MTQRKNIWSQVNTILLICAVILAVFAAGKLWRIYSVEKQNRDYLEKKAEFLSRTPPVLQALEISLRPETVFWGVGHPAEGTMRYDLVLEDFAHVTSETLLEDFVAEFGAAHIGGVGIEPNYGYITADGHFVGMKPTYYYGDDADIPDTIAELIVYYPNTGEWEDWEGRRWRVEL